MTSLIDGAISHSRMVIAILLAALLAGGFTYVNLPKEADPDVPIPFVGVTVPLEGVSPEDAERLIVRPAETEVQTIEGLKVLDGVAAEGAGQLILEFGISFDADQAILDVREKIDLAERDFPDDAREPVITEINAALFPIMVVNLYGEVSERTLYQTADALSDELETLSGVLEARVRGKREDVLEILIDPLKLETYNISYEEVLRTVTNNNQLVPAGRLDLGEGRFPVKVPGLIKSAEDALGLPVIRSGNTIVTLADVASVQRTFKDREVYAEFNGQPAVSLEVVKRSGANILDTADEVRAIIEVAKTGWPQTVEAAITSDQSIYVRQQFNQLQSSIASAVVLVMIIIVAALGLRSAGLVGLAIPASFVLAFLLLGAYGLTVNTMVMFGMVIAVGILVDGAIVVVEYADRKMAEGLHRADAYAMAAKRMFWPIIASNATTLAAFVPFLFWNSLPGKYMSYLPLTLIFVLSASLVMALIFLPVLGAYLGGRASDAGREELASLSGAEGDPRNATGWLGVYVKVSAELIRRPLLVTLAAGCVVAAVFVWFGNTKHKTEFFIDFEPQQVYVFVRAQGNLSAADEYAIVQRAQARVLALDEVISVSMTTGSESTNAGFFDGVGGVPVDTIGRLLVEVHNSQSGNFDGRASEQAIRDTFVDFPGALIEIQKLEYGPSSGKDIQIALLSDDHDALLRTAEVLRVQMDSMAGLREIEDTRPLPGLEWQLKVDRSEAGRFGVDVAQIGAAVQLVTNGILVSQYRPDDSKEEVDIRMRFPEGARSVEALDQLRISTPEGQVPVSLFVDRVPAPRVSSIERRDGKKLVELRANTVNQGEGAALVEEIKAWAARHSLDPNVEIRFGGADEDTAEASGFFQWAAMAALFLMAVILLWEFNNFYHVALTLSAVVLSTTGVLIGIQLYLPYISYLMIGTGIVALAGIVVNNNIVLIDTYQRLRADNRSADEAALAAAAQRIRPILLTTATTISGLLPMMLGMNISFREGLISFGGVSTEWFIPLATAVVFGLGFSTLMTLVVTPAWLAAPSRIAKLRDQLLGRPMHTERLDVSTTLSPQPVADGDLRPAAE